MTTVGELLDRCLAAVGVQRTFGPVALPGAQLAHVPVADPALAALLADAEGRLGPGPGAALLGDGRLRLGDRPDAVAEEVAVRDAAELPAAVAAWSGGAPTAAVELRLDVDLGAPAPDDVVPLSVRAGEAAPVLSPDLLALGPLLVVGPGVQRRGRVASVLDVSERLGLAVLNTFGAKGVLRWDDPRHHGTIGLQERDGELSGLRDAQLLLLVGVDPDELPDAWWRDRLALEVHPDHLDALLLGAPDVAPPVPARPALYDRLAAALGPRYAADDVPLAPARAAADLAAVLPPGGLVAADPGPAGLWVGRALPTTEPGSVVVPATGGRGVGAALALAGALRGRPSLGVTTGPVDERSTALLGVAEDLGRPLVLAAWGDAPPLASAAAHVDLLATALEVGGARVLDVPVALDETRLLVDVAGPVAAWVAS